MAETTAQTTQPRHGRRTPPGLLSRLLGLPFRIVAVLIFSIISAVLIEWVGMAFQWWDQPGAEHALHMMHTEVGWLDSHFTRSLLLSNPVVTVQTAVNAAFDTVLIKTGIGPALMQYSSESGWLGTVATYLLAAIYIALVILVRAVILFLTFPLFVMAALVGFVDGLVRRDLRKFGAGRESAFIYHHAKRWAGPVFITGWLLYLSVPWSIHPNVFLLPCASLFGLIVSITVGSFKKYL
ncbi:TIGR03747 family integrating conjugative element membrane protein [Alloalcanivorax xenomutans]|uniref:TIGR03747 family integrating conjugative element membrane protein n=1 Tax=Alloalcanivorax xenomutans TaxID=1094342 RepID=UPI001F33A619|nr:TIGR03747 family integrating conjugative element membrane protein [Alloalcanivorax xenomutans]MCE7525772.1 TIGR03747 family integrating conjugative element membrane protein [Alloalcanivorax xenomutans]